MRGQRGTWEAVPTAWRTHEETCSPPGPICPMPPTRSCIPPDPTPAVRPYTPKVLYPSPGSPCPSWLHRPPSIADFLALLLVRGPLVHGGTVQGLFPGDSLRKCCFPRGRSPCQSRAVGAVPGGPRAVSSTVQHRDPTTRDCAPTSVCDHSNQTSPPRGLRHTGAQVAMWGSLHKPPGQSQRQRGQRGGCLPGTRLTVVQCLPPEYPARSDRRAQSRSTTRMQPPGRAVD